MEEREAEEEKKREEANNPPEINIDSLLHNYRPSFKKMTKKTLIRSSSKGAIRRVTLIPSYPHSTLMDTLGLLPIRKTEPVTSPSNNIRGGLPPPIPNRTVAQFSPLAKDSTTFSFSGRLAKSSASPQVPLQTSNTEEEKPPPHRKSSLTKKETKKQPLLPPIAPKKYSKEEVKLDIAQSRTVLKRL
eukprot:TRINITY_DN8742_c0_g1_i1.p1 TRINITY_DN8742_c0_g1~~TRINITY_DN8742_c0_g1_i1.p1  ORF type:complete len:187 (+),score=37.67 TRINITY_DN8742_c0_g1_i1:82-642(+)